MNKVFKWALTGLAALVFVGGLAFSLRGREAESDEKTEKPELSKGKRPAKHSGAVSLDRATEERLGIELQALKPATGHPEVTIYGTLEQDPSEEFVLRSPFTGTLIGDTSWPMLGESVSAGAKVGAIRPRLAAMDRITLSDRLASIHSEVAAAQSSVAVALEEVNRLRQLNADDKNASDKALQEGEARLTTEEARLNAAQASERLIGAALQPGSGSAPLEILRGGQVIEVPAQPGESVESGQVLVRVASFNRLLARIHVPPGQVVDASVTRATIAPAGHEEDAVPAERVAFTGSIDPKYQGETLLFRITPERLVLRPGEAIAARIAVPGKNERGVVIPSRAILRFQGQTWVYTRTEAGEFVRRLVTPDRASGEGWFAASGFRPGEQVVVSGAQLLLSEEMKSQLEPDDQ